MKAETIEKINKNFDKFFELHYWLHEIENNYHKADQFRWLHNVFINTYQITFNHLSYVLKKTDYEKEYKEIKKNYFNKNNILKITTDLRDIIVHEEDLKLNSIASLCLIKDKKGNDKFRLPFSKNNYNNSDELIIEILKNKFYYNIFMNDEDYYLAVYREWKINKNNCILEENRKILMIMSNFIHDISILIKCCNNKENLFHLKCCPPINDIKYKIYDRKNLIKKLNYL
jgi:hypothetical protein